MSLLSKNLILPELDLLFLPPLLSTISVNSLDVYHCECSAKAPSIKELESSVFNFLTQT
jgi:ribosomal protein L16 Arg81 hydroxylase